MRQQLRMATLGGVGGALGMLLGEALGDRQWGQRSGAGLVLAVAAWSATTSIPIAVTLRWAIARQGRHLFPSPRQLARTISVGTIVGAASGASAQFVYNQFSNGNLKEYFARPLCWGIMGGLLGYALTFAIPNLKRARGGILGLIGGTVGGAAFVASSHLGLPATVSRGLGGIAIGALIGLGVAIAEALQVQRSTSIEVIHGPNESMRIALGRDAITFGASSRDTVYVHGFDARALTIVLRQGTVYAHQPSRGEVPLRDGSTIQLGKVTIRVKQA